MSRTICTMVVIGLVNGLAATSVLAASGGVQWSHDGLRILANKDVGAERWAITLNLDDATVTGNVFFSDGRPPRFISCEGTGHSYQPDVSKLTVQYRCFGSDPAQSVFASTDWNVVGDPVMLDAAFFAPTPETCDLSGALNGAGPPTATSLWDCTSTTAPFWIELFSDGTALSSAIGRFTFDAVATGCGFAKLSDGTFFNLGYSPSRQILTVYRTTPGVDRFSLSECRRVVF